MIVFVNSQREEPWPGVANAIPRDLTRLIFPGNLAYSGIATAQ
jgi:hypothetical protein